MLPAERIRGDGTDYRDGAGVLTLLVVEEVEDAIGDYFSTDGGSELIAHEWGAWNSGVVSVEPGVRGEEGVAVVFVERAVKLIRPALGKERDLTAGGAAEVGAFAGYGDAKFLGRSREEWGRTALNPELLLTPLALEP